MPRKDHLDAFGVASLIFFAALLGFNQVVIKVVNDGLQPEFFAGLRSAGAIVCMWLWMRVRGNAFTFDRASAIAGVISGLIFGGEFLLLFRAIDLTTVSRVSVIFYTMPVWLALAAHVLLPGDRITPRKALGLALAVAGVAWAFADRGTGGAASLRGDLFALIASMAWAAIALIARASPLARVSPEMQLFWQVLVSAPMLLLAAPFFGPLVRDLQPLHLWGLAFQIVAIASFAFVFWFWLLTIYPASSVVSFSFLTPIFGVLFGWAILGEAVGVTVLGALALVAGGLWLINTSGPSRG